MVLYFHPIGYGPGKDDNLIYVGKDKHENEDLIKYGLPQDIWFHVSDLSSAHVYLRLPQGQTMDSISQETLDDCIQLVKANSITGNKTNNIDIVYTPWSNLKKTASMEVGQVGFYSNKLVKKVRVEKRVNDIVNRLNKTKQELYPDLAAERETYDRGIRATKKAEVQDVKKAERAAKEEEQRQADLRSYKNVMTADSMSSNKDMAQKYKSAADYEDDFM
ncbi:hypothetical protein ABBQ38_014103 [Trebouxia sp. C0009 RCD-2024]